MAKKASSLLLGSDRALAKRLESKPQLLQDAARRIVSETSVRLEAAHDSIRRLSREDLSVRVNVTTVTGPTASEPKDSGKRKK